MIKDVPQAYVGPFDWIVRLMREWLAQGKEIRPCAFVGRIGEQEMYVTELPELAGGTMAVAQFMAVLAEDTNADFIVTVAEVRGLAVGAEEVRRDLGQLGTATAESGGFDAILFQLETHAGMWVALPQVSQATGDGTRRDLGPVELALAREHVVMFYGLAPRDGLTRH